MVKAYHGSRGLCSKHPEACAGNEQQLMVTIKRARFKVPNFYDTISIKPLSFMLTEPITCWDTLLPAMLNNDHLLLLFFASFRVPRVDYAQ